MKENVAKRLAFFASEEFDKKFRYDGKDLGAVCREGRTVFKVWSPLAERIELRLYRDSASESYLRQEMQAGEKGVWSLAFEESLHGVYYDYEVVIDGKETCTADPYAVGCGCNGDRSMVVPMTRTAAFRRSTGGNTRHLP